jgi:hypothetical protein
MIPDCTLVTGCFDVTKYNNKCRNVEQSLVNMASLLKTPCYLIIFTDKISVESIKKIRNEAGLEKLTRYYVSDDVSTIDSFQYTDIVKKNREKYHPTRDERTCAESHLVCCNKFDLVLKSIEINPFHTTKFGWIDANIGENFSKICTNYKNNMLLDVLTHADPKKFTLQVMNVCNKKYTLEENLREYYSRYQWVVCGCLFITGKEVGIEILNDLKDTFIKHTTLGYGHGEEMFYLEILDKHYDKINRSYGDYQHILNNFVRINEGINYIYHNIANNYLSHGYYKEGIDCCNAVLKRYDNFEIEMNYDLYFRFLFVKYVCLFYYDRQQAREFTRMVLHQIETNPYIHIEYLKNKEFYATQFALV